ncbi:hypothetical protein HPP92_029076 [Vanilla planifolia]|uniref:Uncharacterized protein n=1 Tax=Vanilla planifolia TaxID=51239 RepID=A0A835P3P9_VANPL|nr:hypothetical protein HPP92_029065 [Vanilla planifolia]KAG0445965.1 hypothetical protein HPP92_029076 [Vanilla planifolia]
MTYGVALPHLYVIMHCRRLPTGTVTNVAQNQKMRCAQGMRKGRHLENLFQSPVLDSAAQPASPCSLGLQVELGIRTEPSTAGDDEERTTRTIDDAPRRGTHH